MGEIITVVNETFIRKETAKAKLSKNYENKYITIDLKSIILCRKVVATIVLPFIIYI